MSIYIDLYRTRIYLPLAILIFVWLFSGKFRKLIWNFMKKTNECKTGYVAVICGTVSFILAVLVIYPGKSWGGDFSQYFAQARAMVTGTVDEWFLRNKFIIDTSCDGIGADVYPWLWAIMIAPFYAICGEFPIIPLKIFGAVFVTGTVIILVYYYNRRVSLSKALVLSFFTAFSASILFLINALEADVVCLFFVVATVNAVDLYNRATEKKKLILYAVLSGVLLWASVQTKTMAKGAVLALICYDVLFAVTLMFEKKKWKFIFAIDHQQKNFSLLRAIPYAVYFVLTALINAVLPKAGGTYNGYFTVSMDAFLVMCGRYFKLFQEFFGDPCRPIISAILVCAVVILFVGAIIGAFVFFKREAYSIIYCCGMALMLLFYDYARIGFVFTLYPFLILLCGEVILWLYDKLRSDAAKAGVMAPVILILCLMFLQTAYLSYSIHFKGYNINDIYNEPTQGAFEYIKENLSSDDVVYFFRPRVLYYYTDVDSYTWAGDYPEKIDKAGYVLISKWTEWPLIRETLADETKYEVVYSNDVYTLWKKINN